ncbi:MAG: hypothetical protein ACREVB_07115 [Burkholderiales bacterium]|jgi:hypothetical protein
MKAPKTVVRTASERLGGGRPTRVRASVTAAAVGGAIAVTVYRALRS